MYRLVTTLVIAVFPLAGLQAQSLPPLEESHKVELEIESGRLSGSVDDGIAVFKGIPYAKPPIGELRWAPTETVDSWEGIRDATEFSAPCAQPYLGQSDETTENENSPWVFQSEGAFTALNVEILPGSSEDCLYLNVWSPNNRLDTSGLPVMLWFHGGSGSSSEAFFDGTNFAKQGVVLVTFNRRMSSLASFSHPALTKESEQAGQALTSYSRMDQLEVLHWIQRNIESFGGDKHNVTVFGQSAGGAAIEGLLTTERAEGLFHKAIVQSGSGFRGSVSHEQHEQLGVALLSAMGLDGPNLSAQDLRDIPVERIPWAGVSFKRERDRSATIESEQIIDVPMIIGWNSFDGSSLRFPSDEMLANTPSSVREVYEKHGLAGDDLVYSIYTDRRNGAPAKWLATHTSSGSPSYLYYFDYVLTLARNFLRGAEHGREVIHVFDNWLKTPPDVVPNIGALLREQDLEMSRIMQECWVNFASSGVPSCARTPTWKPYNKESDELMVFGTTNRMESGFRKDFLNIQIENRRETMGNRRNDYRRLMQDLKEMH